jgi:hypothetical protein
VPFDGQWHHLAATLLGQEIKFYLDGLPKDSKTYVGTPVTNTSELVIGNHAGYWRAFYGAIDEVCIYNRALNDAEIAQLAAIPLPGAIWLLGSGLLGLAGLRQRQKK